jgi:hypothetical protein
MDRPQPSLIYCMCRHLSKGSIINRVRVTAIKKRNGIEIIEINNIIGMQMFL